MRFGVVDKKLAELRKQTGILRDCAASLQKIADATELSAKAVRKIPRGNYAVRTHGNGYDS